MAPAGSSLQKIDYTSMSEAAMREWGFWGARSKQFGQSADGPFGVLRRNMPLVPSATIAGRALVTVVAIMTFLASLAAGGAILIAAASRDWNQSVSSAMTIQIRPTPGRDTDTDVRNAADIARNTPGVASVRVYSKKDSDRMLEPWLGQGLDLSDLPIPRLIAVETIQGRPPDVAALRKRLATKTPSAYLDDHRGWVERLTTMARALVVFALIIFVLVLVAMALAVAFATRGAMAGNREIIDVLHFVGAEDRFVARQFQRHFLRLGLKGGVIGGACAIATFLGTGLLSALWTATPSGDQMEALFGAFSLGSFGYGAIALIACGIALLTGMVSRLIVVRHLRQLT